MPYWIHSLAGMDLLVGLTITPKTSVRFLNVRWLMGLGIVFATVNVNADVPVDNSADIEMGRRIYMEGVLPSGQPLQGKRLGSVQVEGPTAACESCHRRSGMGSLEGNVVVPPITGRFLFAEEPQQPMALLDPREAKNVTRTHTPYTEITLARSIRDGVNVSYKVMNPLMPKYDLSDNEIKAVAAYLRQLSAELSPGVGEDSMQFATIVTPDVSKVQRDALIGMIQAAFKQRNASQQNYSGRMRMPIDLIPRTIRNWELTVWELKGEAGTWSQQLAEYYRRQPVFAVISGISNTSWGPVDAFCQQEKLPCILPSVDLPPTKTHFYSLYYSRGVALEAAVLAKHLGLQSKKTANRLIQIYRDEALGRCAAQALANALLDSGIQVENRVYDGQSISAKSVLKDLTQQDAVMFWLRPEDLSTLHDAAPKKLAASLFVSGFMADENYGFVSKNWRSQLKVIYPLELGKGRDKNVTALKSWLKAWKLPLVDEVMQTEVFFSLLFLTDLSSQMLDNLYRDYMVERAEDMLSYGSNSSAYPHLSMARGQRFASKGAYIAHFSRDGKLVPDTQWIVP